jgi:hypothetical protein
MTAIKRWTPRHDRAVAALLVSPSITAAAARAGVGEKTLRRWLDCAIFKDHLDAAQHESQDKAIGLLRQLSMQAVATIGRAMRCGQPATELRAALAVLDLGMRARELDHLTDPTVEQIDLWLARAERRITQADPDRDLWTAERELWSGR